MTDAKKLRAEIEDTLLRNLSILREEDPDSKTISVWTVESLMRACAGNLAQILAPRLTDGDCCALCDETKVTK